MALIACPECSKQVSSLAESCPTCGLPVRPRNGYALALQGVGLGLLVAIGSIGGGLVIAALLLLVAGGSAWRRGVSGRSGAPPRSGGMGTRPHAGGAPLDRARGA